MKLGENGGQGGIRTHDTLLTYTHFPGVRLRPLGHLSADAFLRRAAGSALLIAGTAARSTSKSTGGVNHENTLRAQQSVMPVAARGQSAYVKRIRQTSFRHVDMIRLFFRTLALLLLAGAGVASAVDSSRSIAA